MCTAHFIAYIPSLPCFIREAGCPAHVALHTLAVNNTAGTLHTRARSGTIRSASDTIYSRLPTSVPSFDIEQPIRAEPPSRAATMGNPLDFGLHNVDLWRSEEMQLVQVQLEGFTLLQSAVCRQPPTLLIISFIAVICTADDPCRERSRHDRSTRGGRPAAVQGPEHPQKCLPAHICQPGWLQPLL